MGVRTEDWGMRSVVVNNIVSLDGFYADERGNPVVLNMDETFDAYNLERMRVAGTVLLGRTSFEGFGGYWPFIVDAPEDASNRALSEDNREISRLYNGIPKVVVSDSFEVPADHPCRQPPRSSDVETWPGGWNRRNARALVTSSSSPAASCGTACYPTDSSTSCTSPSAPLPSLAACPCFSDPSICP